MCGGGEGGIREVEKDWEGEFILWDGGEGNSTRGEAGRIGEWNLQWSLQCTGGAEEVLGSEG